VQNNFTFLRLLFALFVVVTHSYPLSGVATGDFLNRITEGQAELSYLGLSGFFIISGYLCFQSLERCKHLGEYYWKRALRIFPGLFVVLLLTVVLCIYVYDSDVSDYLSNASMWTYLPANMSIIKQQLTIEGVFTHNPYNSTINGSLWSLEYEVVFYIWLSALFFFPRKAKITIVTIALAVLITSYIFFMEQVGSHKYMFLRGKLLLEFGPYFFGGVLLSLLRIESLRQRTWLSAVLVLMLVCAFYLKYFTPLKFFILPPLVLLIATSSAKPIARFMERTGDLSYGIYIYAFPIQQALMYFFGFNSLQLMIVSVPLSIMAGYMSWHLIEKRCLRYKYLQTGLKLRTEKSKSEL
jgi:peptidoglycan/LPS O-acetylase OafA/YrhL